MAVLMMLAALLCLLLAPIEGHLLLLPENTRAKFNDDIESFNFKNSGSAGTFTSSSYSGTTSGGRAYTAFTAVVHNGLPASFGFELPAGGCAELQNVSHTAQLRNCSYSTNAGLFNYSGACVGNVVINGSVKQLQGQLRVSFGLTDSLFVVGYITNSTLRTKYKWLQLVSGAGWLVRSSASYIKTSAMTEQLPNKFVTEKAPRTGLCVASNGSLIIVQVDGVERENLGLDLYEFTELFMKMKCIHAVNLDGGGSSTSVYEGKVIDKPTCMDVSVVCERKVSTITCVRG